MNNYKSLAEHWHRKLMKTPVSYQALITYRFEKWQYYKRLARQATMDHLRGESHE